MFCLVSLTLNLLNQMKPYVMPLFSFAKVSDRYKDVPPVPYVGKLLPGVGTLEIGQYGSPGTDGFLSPVKFPWCAVLWANDSFTVTTSYGTKVYPWKSGMVGTLKITA